MRPACSRSGLTRRQWLGAAAAWPALGAAQTPAAPTAPVAVARAADYGPQLTPTLERMFDQLGGLGRLVRGKTVAIKINMTGGPRTRMGYTPCEDAQYTHPAVIGATIHLLGKAGAARVRVIEGCYSSSDPLEEFMYDSGWDPAPLATAAPKVEFANTNFLSKGERRYARFMVPGKGYIFSGFDLHPWHEECDVFVSIAKMKEHGTCGVTLAMKNCFGCTPLTIYGDSAGVDEPGQDTTGGRGSIMHRGQRGPSKSAPQEVNPAGPRDDRYRMPRIVADIAAARPIHVSIIDGIRTMAGGEGPWIGRVWPVAPGLLVAGTNAVTTDAISTALMGFDPLASRGKAPFEHCDSTLELAEAHGIGTRDPARIEVVGTPVAQAVFRFRGSRPA
jgi:uncharacterized protein (DUF362 family)